MTGKASTSNIAVISVIHVKSGMRIIDITRRPHVDDCHE